MQKDQFMYNYSCEPDVQVANCSNSQFETFFFFNLWISMMSKRGDIPNYLSHTTLTVSTETPPTCSTCWAASQRKVRLKSWTIGAIRV